MRGPFLDWIPHSSRIAPHMRVADVPLLVLPLCLATACATDAAVEQELSNLRRQMHGLQQQVQKQRLEIERLEGRVTLMSLNAEPARAQPTAPVSSQTAVPKTVRPERGPERALPVVRMTAKADAQGNDVVVPWEDPGAQDDGSPPVVIKLGPSRSKDPVRTSERLAVDHAVLAKPDPNVAAKKERKRKKQKRNKKATRAQIRKAYDDALGLLRDDKDAAGALERFEVFVDSYPRSRLADNAMYWAGECELELSQWSAAAVTFGRLLRSHPRSAKVPYAKVGLGRARMMLGDRAKGEALLREVIERYPTSEAANEASLLLGAKESE